MKRRNSNSLTLKDAIKYADIREAAKEAVRLSKLTDNNFIKDILKNCATKFWNDLGSWLDEELEDGDL